MLFLAAKKELTNIIYSKKIIFQIKVIFGS